MWPPGGAKPLFFPHAEFFPFASLFHHSNFSFVHLIRAKIANFFAFQIMPELMLELHHKTLQTRSQRQATGGGGGLGRLTSLAEAGGGSCCSEPAEQAAAASRSSGSLSS